MSKNIRKKTTAKADNTAEYTVDQFCSVLAANLEESRERVAERAADEKQRAKEQREQNQCEQADPALTAPLGTASSTAASVTGTTVFDVIDGLSMVGQTTALRSIANGAICAAVFICNEYLSYAGPRHDTGELSTTQLTDLERWERLPARMTQQADLYSWSAAKLQLLRASRFDDPMTLAEAIEFAANSAGLNRQGDELPDEVLEALGVTRAQLALIDADERRKQVARDQQLREQVRTNAADIAGELGSMVDVMHADDAVLGSFTADQHAALYRKVARKLGARFNQLLGMRSRYDGAIADAMLVSSDVRATDKACVAFLRANEGELTER